MKIRSYLSGGVQYGLILIAVLICSELISVILGGDWGSLLWVTFHFVLNPILCIIYVLLVVIKFSKKNSMFDNLLCIPFILLAIFYLYIAFTGRVEWVEIFGINFNK